MEPPLREAPYKQQMAAIEYDLSALPNAVPRFFSGTALMPGKSPGHFRIATKTTLLSASSRNRQGPPVKLSPFRNLLTYRFLVGNFRTAKICLLSLDRLPPLDEKPGACSPRNPFQIPQTRHSQCPFQKNTLRIGCLSPSRVSGFPTR